MADDQTARMRVRHGRVMHLVEPAGSGWLRSVCRRTLDTADNWTAERHWYPDCKHCPAQEATNG